MKLPITIRSAAIGACLVAVMLSGFAAPCFASGWHIEQKKDRFTDAATCRAEPQSALTRAIAAGMLEIYAPSYFFIEKRDDELRVGVTNDKALPVISDVQVRVDRRPAIMITARDTPLDYAPAYPAPNLSGLTPALKEQIESSMRTSMAMMSPYRVLLGEKARELLAQLVTAKEAKWRFIGLNTTSDRAIDIPTSGLLEVVQKCGIELRPPAAVVEGHSDKPPAS